MRSRKSGHWLWRNAANTPSGTPSRIDSAMRRERQFQRRRQALHDIQRHRPVGERALAEIQPHRLAGIDDELLPDRQIEAILLRGSRRSAPASPHRPPSPRPDRTAPPWISRKVMTSSPTSDGTPARSAAGRTAPESCGASEIQRISHALPDGAEAPALDPVVDALELHGVVDPDVGTVRHDLRIAFSYSGARSCCSDVSARLPQQRVDLRRSCSSSRPSTCRGTGCRTSGRPSSPDRRNRC